jgi:hypothetical protein
MPLVATGWEPAVRFEWPHQGLLFDMLDEDQNQVIRSLITSEALHRHLDRSARPRDEFSGREIFDEHRGTIEAAASRKYDRRGTNDELDGRPLLLVLSMDL